MVCSLWWPQQGIEILENCACSISLMMLIMILSHQTDYFIDNVFKRRERRVHLTKSQPLLAVKEWFECQRMPSYPKQKGGREGEREKKGRKGKEGKKKEERNLIIKDALMSNCSKFQTLNFKEICTVRDT